MKRVVNNSQVAHLWANQTQDHAQNSNRSFWYNYKVIYSYQTPIANILEGVNGQRVYLISDDTHSATTSSKHHPEIRHAVRHNGAAFSVRFIGVSGGWHAHDTRDLAEMHRANLDWYSVEYQTELQKAARRIMYAPVGAGTGIAERCRLYCQAFGIDAPAWTSEDACTMPAAISLSALKFCGSPRC